MPVSARSLPHQQTAIHATDASSQEEYDDSESDDDDRLITSSTENVPFSPERLDAADDSSDDGDDATALGRVSDRPTFRPQPNAFSHPASLSHRSNSSSAAVPSLTHGEFTRPSFSRRSQTRVGRGPAAFMSPSAREDHDAALRASLTTLLSCAAAARGLPKSRDETDTRRTTGPGVAPSNQPMDLRLVPESELMGEGESTQPRSGTTQPKQRTTPARSPSRTNRSSDSTKRSSSAGQTPRASKKKKTDTMAAEETYISPTLLTWAVSAGVVVLISVVGFGAGYIIGREVGRQEVLSASVGGVNETASCGREVIRTSSGGLRRFKWGAVGKSIVA